ncbi:MAG: 50S ribosomal protein L6 [Candidatus Gracilibacteria bacterium]|nr:50S ribosomal protein L6 [Candidatus Gracilibacteria bacterium]
MSRIGKQPVKLPSGVTVEINSTDIIVKGSKGTLSFNILSGVSVKQEGEILTVSIENQEDKQQKAFWGLTRAMIQNMVIGVSEGYSKSLEIVGVGYKFDVKGPRKMELALGFSHKVNVDAPEGITIEADKEEKNKIHLKSHDKQLLGYFAAYVRSLKKPEPYKGKGIRYTGEHIRRKAGKTAGK